MRKRAKRLLPNDDVDYDWTDLEAATIGMGTMTKRDSLHSIAESLAQRFEELTKKRAPRKRKRSTK